MPSYLDILIFSSRNLYIYIQIFFPASCRNRKKFKFFAFRCQVVLQYELKILSLMHNELIARSLKKVGKLLQTYYFLTSTYWSDLWPWHVRHYNEPKEEPNKQDARLLKKTIREKISNYLPENNLRSPFEVQEV